MKCVEELVKEVYDSCKIPFQLTIEEVGEFSTPLFELVQNQSEKSFNYNNTKCCIKVNTALSITLDLLKLYIEERLNKVFLSKKSIVSLLLNDKVIEEEVIKASWPILIEEFDLINIYVDNYRNEIMSYLKQGYCCKEVEIISHNGHILMFGKFEDILEHAKSIKYTIEGAVPCKAYIGYCNVESYLMLKKYYDDTSYKINLAFKYNIIDRIFDSNKLILEGIIDAVSEEMKNDIYISFEKGIAKLDNEMIRTMEVFFKCGLNLSEASKELYIHRNTLIYRLDKIQKYTNYDIREFNDAVLLKIIFFIWKEKNEKKLEDVLKVV